MSCIRVMYGLYESRADHMALCIAVVVAHALFPPSLALSCIDHSHLLKGIDVISFFARERTQDPSSAYWEGRRGLGPHSHRFITFRVCLEDATTSMCRSIHRSIDLPLTSNAREPVRCRMMDEEENYTPSFSFARRMITYTWFQAVYFPPPPPSTSFCRLLLNLSHQSKRKQKQ